MSAAMMPNFFVIGAAKCGTTSIHNYLSQHPQIFMSAIKEPNFFAFEGEEVNFKGFADNDNLPVKDPGDYDNCRYRRTITDINAYKNLFKNSAGKIAIGESSPCYSYIPKASERIKHHVPHAKLIAILRDPVDRAYSQYKSMIRYSHEPLDFLSAIEAEQNRIYDNWAPTYHYKSRGFYYKHLKRYYDIFDKNQIRVYLFENFSRYTADVLRDLFTFLEVDNTFIPDLTVKHNVGSEQIILKNKTINDFLVKKSMIKSALMHITPDIFISMLKKRILKHNTDYAKNIVKSRLPVETRMRLISEYHEDITQLQELIGRDLSHWLKC